MPDKRAIRDILIYVDGGQFSYPLHFTNRLQMGPTDCELGQIFDDVSSCHLKHHRGFLKRSCKQTCGHGFPLIYNDFSSSPLITREQAYSEAEIGSSKHSWNKHLDVQYVGFTATPKDTVVVKSYAYRGRLADCI